MSQKSALTAVLKGECPRCRKGKMFKYPLLHITKLTQMYQTCSSCGLMYEREPGFFFGAMYVSYAFSVALFIINIFVLYKFFGDPEVWVYIVSIITSAILLYPFLFRYSRIIFLHVFGGVKFANESGDG